MKIVFISTEVYPFAKTGGLADVLYSLPDALVKKGHDIAVIMPAYKHVDRQKFQLQLLFPALSVPYGPEEKFAAVYFSSEFTSFNTYFIEYNPFFGRDGYYGDTYGEFQDNPDRFAFFCLSALVLLDEMDFHPDIINCNEWQTGLVPLLLKNIFSKNLRFKQTSTVMTVHNAGYQGVFENGHFLSQLKLNNFNINDITADGRINFLKAGIIFADMITTVSKNYSREIQTVEFGHALADIFRQRNDRLYGILNGTDDEQWDPFTDVHIPERYSFADFRGKKACKLELQSRMGLPVDEKVPVIGVVSRLTHQKGLDILADALEYLMQDDNFQFVAAGSGDEWIYKRYERLKRMFPQKTGLFYGYDEELAHIIQAGLDIFIMPSRYEPCGLSVMYSLKYGTIPVVRATGGLDDIIIDWEISHKSGNGFKFNDLSIKELYNIIRKTIRYYRDEKQWKTIQKNAMEFSRSWNDAVLEYEVVYKTALNYQK